MGQLSPTSRGEPGVEWLDAANRLEELRESLACTADHIADTADRLARAREFVAVSATAEFREHLLRGRVRADRLAQGERETAMRLRGKNDPADRRSR
jgi:hypothetical protein